MLEECEMDNRFRLEANHDYNKRMAAADP